MRAVSRIASPTTVCVCILSVATLLFSCYSFSAKGSPAAADNRTRAGDATPVVVDSREIEQLERQMVQIKQAFPHDVDIFFDLRELQANTPALSEAEISADVRIVLGVAYYRVQGNDGEEWLVRPESIFAVRVSPTK